MKSGVFCLTSVAIGFFSLMFLDPGYNVVMGYSDNPQAVAEQQSEQTSIHQFMLNHKMEAEQLWKEKVSMETLTRVKTEQENQIQLMENKKKAEAEKKRVKAEAVELAKKRAEEAKEIAAKMEKKAAEKAEKAKKDANGSNDVVIGKGVSYSVGSGGNSKYKSWMNYKSITSQTSPQWKLQHSNAYTGDYGIRMVDGRYCIAVGSHYASKIGTKIDVVLESGKTIKCILADQKSDDDTDSSHCYHVVDGSYVEFVVDLSELDSAAKTSGDISSISGFSGKVSKIIVYK